MKHKYWVIIFILACNFPRTSNGVAFRILNHVELSSTPQETKIESKIESYTEQSIIKSDLMVSWVLNRMVSWYPPGRSFIPEAQETQDEGLKRYNDIAKSIINVSYDNLEASLFEGDNGRAHTAALMLSIIWYESGFRKDVDLGIGNKSRGDNGRSWCLIQAQLGSPKLDGDTSLKLALSSDDIKYVNESGISDSVKEELIIFGGKDLVQNRDHCIRAGLRMARKSLRTCNFLPLDERLAGLSGSCDRGRKDSKARMYRAGRVMADFPPPLTDSEELAALN